jgi:predicted enzyme related to lactoylglutathione lyase
MTTHGHFHWNELMTHDVEKAKKFYADTLGWSYEGMPMPEGTYWVASAGGEPVGGIVDAGSDGAPEAWIGYIAVDDVDARTKKAVQAGAKVLQPAFDIPGVGRIVILAEPGGAAIGWMTPAEQ